MFMERRIKDEVEKQTKELKEKVEKVTKELEEKVGHLEQKCAALDCPVCSTNRKE